MASITLERSNPLGQLTAQAKQEAQIQTVLELEISSSNPNRASSMIRRGEMSMLVAVGQLAEHRPHW